MMFEIEIKRSNRRCCVKERDLLPGEVYYTALVEEGDDLQRLDYCQEAWQGPPAESFAWWRSQIPVPGKNRIYWAPNDALLAYFQQLTDRPEKKATRYLMALLLLRRRLLTTRAPGLEADDRHLLLHSAKLKVDFDVEICELSADQLAEIQAELSEKLFMDQPDLESPSTTMEDAQSGENEA